MAKVTLNFTRDSSDDFAGTFRGKLDVELIGTLKINGKELPESGVEYILTMGARNPAMDSYSAAKTADEAKKLFDAKVGRMVRGESRVGSGKESNPVRRGLLDWANRADKENWRAKNPGKALKHYNPKTRTAQIVALLKSPEAESVAKALGSIYNKKPAAETVTPAPVESPPAA